MNRNTLYAHFRNPYDLLAHIEAEALQDLKARLLAESDGSFQQQIMKLAHLASIQLSDRHEAFDADNREYMYPFAASGTPDMRSHWLKKGTPQSPAKMSELLLRVIQLRIEERV